MKKIIAMLLVLVMILSLYACGAKDEKVTLNVIAAQYGTKTADWWKGFEAANEGIDLVIDVPSWNDIYTVVNTRIANGEAPDILNIDVFADYQADGLLLPTQDYVSDETYAKFYPQFLEQSIVDGTVWTVPDLASVRALYYNADILAAADPAAAAWIDSVGSANFYPAAKAEWADVKQGVIGVQQKVLLGGDAQALPDALQADIAG